MGLLDRDYYRDDLPERDSLGDNVLCNLLVVALLGVFVAQAISLPSFIPIPEEDRILVLVAPDRDFRIDGLTRAFALDPSIVARGHIWRPLTSTFLHHPPLADAPAVYVLVVWNLALFWLAGRSLEWRLGLPELLMFFIVAGLLGNALAVAAILFLPVPGPPMPIYASPMSAVAAVLVLASLLYPKTTLGRFRFPTWVLLLLYAGVHAATFSLGLRTGEHPAMLLGGAAFAFLYWRRRWRLREVLRWLSESGPQDGR